MRRCTRCNEVKTDTEFPEVASREGFDCNSCTLEYRLLQEFPKSYSCVYLIKGGDLYKIGFTTDLPKRVATLRTMSPVALTLEHAWAGERAHETAFHRRFQPQRHHGEWFSLTANRVQKIKKQSVPMILNLPG